MTQEQPSPGLDTGPLGQGSLLEGIAVNAAASRPQPRTTVSPLKRLDATLKTKIAAWKAWAGASVDRKRKVRLASWIACGLLVVGAGAGAYMVFGPTPKPDYEVDPFDDVLDYTLLTDDFNSLPLDQRLELIRQLVGRFKDMGDSESSLVAAFAAGISGEARKQLEKNASRLVLDLMDKHALEYEKAKPEDKEKALDDALVGLSKTFEALGGKISDKTDSERIAEAEENAKRDEKWIKSADSQRLGDMTGRMMSTMNDTIAQQASPQQRGRMAPMMRDMTRHLRGQSVK
ncbi:MAG: hypothetical protein AABZ53_03185 [Planctomycetota bacterium]